MTSFPSTSAEGSGGPESAAVHLVNLGFNGIHGAIAAFVGMEPEPWVVDPGPTSSVAALEEGLADLGLAIADLRRVVLTHIHLDHAGCTGELVRRNPAITVHVHADGAPHLIDPEKLVNSTRLTFGARSDEMWGSVTPVPAERVRVWTASSPDAPPGLRVLESPGHIRHHLAYQVELDGTLLTGDAMGIILGPGSPVHTPTPPPSLDLVAWYDTLEGWASLDVPVFGVTHFGWHERFQERRQEFLMALRSHEDRVRSDLEAGINGAKAYAAEVVERMTPGPDRTWIEGYFETFGAEADWQGVAFYLNRRARRINRSS